MNQRELLLKNIIRDICEKEPNATTRKRRKKALRPREMQNATVKKGKWRRNGDHMKTCLLTEVDWERREYLCLFIIYSFWPFHPGNK